MKTLCCIAFLLLLFHFSHQQLPAGRCEPFQGAPMSQCGSVVNYDVFVPQGMSQSDLDKLAADKNGVFRLGLTSISCTEDAMLFICAEAFRRCSVVELGGSPVALPQPTCRRRCDQFVDRCSTQVQAIGSSIDVQCDAVSPTTGSPVYPTSTTILNLPNGAVARLPCNNPDFVAPYVEIPRARCVTLSELDTPSSGCANVITGSVYLPAGFTIEELDAAAAAKTILARSGTLSKRCSDAMMEFVCAEAYRRCDEIVVDPRIRPITLPSNTCYEDCWRFRGECTPELTKLTVEGKIPRSAPVVCEAENPNIPGTQPLYPPEATIYSLQGNQISVPCSYPKVRGPYALPTCEPFSGFPEECASVVDYDVLILPGSTQEQLAAQAKVALAGIQVAPTSCRKLALRLLCSTIFLRCAPQGISPAVTVNLPAFTCQSFCQETKTICEAVSPTDTAIDCNLMSNGQQVYPEKDSRTIIGGSEYVVPCYIPTYTSEGYPELENCPYPLQETGDDEEVCNIQCPLPAFSEGEFMAHMITVTVLAYLSLFLGALTVLSFAIHPLKRTFPRNLVMLQVAAATLKSIGYLIPHWVYSGGYAYHDVICENDTTLARGASHASCAAQSFFLYVFGFSQVLWYFMVALFLVRAAFSVQIPGIAYYPLQILLHFICWVVPLILWICLMATDNISSSGVYPCFADASKWNYTFYGVLFYYPVTAILLCGMLMVTIAVVTILKRTGRRGLSKQFRLLLYLLYTFLSNGYVVFDHYYIRANRAKYDENLERFALCSATSLEPCELHGSLPYGLFVAYGVIYSSQPLFFALILLLDPGVWKTWYWSIRKYILREDIDVLEKLGLQKGARKAKRRITQDNNHPISRVSRSDLEYSDEDWAGE